MSGIAVNTIYTHPKHKGIELVCVDVNKIEVCKDGLHVANLKVESYAPMAFAEGYFAGLLSAKKDF